MLPERTVDVTESHAAIEHLDARLAEAAAAARAARAAATAAGRADRIREDVESGRDAARREQRRAVGDAERRPAVGPIGVGTAGRRIHGVHAVLRAREARLRRIRRERRERREEYD